MKAVKVYRYDAFSTEPGKGNPAGVVLDGDHLTDQQMQEIAFKVGFNETAFPIKSEKADLRIRFFTPGHEMNLCGHATMATVYALRTKGLLGNQSELTIETNAGILPVHISQTAGGHIEITMKQAAPQYQNFEGSKEELAHSIGLDAVDLDNELPILYGSTGTWTLLVPVKKLVSFHNMKPENGQFPAILKEMPASSVHPFCMETFDPEADMHARHFSSPHSGTIEDAVTGTASGVMGAYYAEYITNQSFNEPLQLVVEQGQEIEKDGRVKVQVSKNSEQYEISIAGSAVYVEEFEVLVVAKGKG